MKMRKLLMVAGGLLMAMTTFGQRWTANGDTLTMEGYVIDGRITGPYEGKVYLVKEDGMHGPQTRVDSAVVTDGRFRFEGEKAPEYPVVYFIQSMDGQLAPVFLDRGHIQIQMRADYFLGAVASGTVNNSLWQIHQMKVNYMIDSIRLAGNVQVMRKGIESFEQRDKDFRHRTQLQNTTKLNMEKAMVRYYNNEAFAPFIMLFEMTFELSLDELKALRAELDPQLNEHPYTKELDELIAQKEFKVGSPAPNFSIRGMNGEDLELKNYAGKYVLLDFWASWCGPCRREMPNVVKLYKEMKGKNFEIIGISLDQKEEPWKKAVKDLKMTWPQACDFQVWYGKVARAYNLSAVPYTVLINPEGKVEAIDLRGEELIETVKRLVKGKK